MARDSVHLTDLRHPRFGPEAQAVIDAVAAMAPTLELTPAALLAHARAETGLHHIGDPGVLERLECYVEALGREGELSPLGRVNSFLQIAQLLRNRLLVEDLLARHPQIHDEQVVAPIVIVGMPRTGTTHLHNLLAADPALRSLPYWESLEPVLPAGEAPPPGGRDPRLDRTDVATGVLNLVMPEFARMHEMTTEHVHEEIQLLAVDMSTMLFETAVPLPSWRDFYLAHDQTPHYEYLATLLKVCQWQRNGPGARVRWVLKSPQHLEQLPALRRVFPDATFVVTHRDPVAICASFVTMVTYTARMNRARIDPVEYGVYWTDRIERMLRACVRDRDLLPAARSIDVHLREFMADDLAMVRRIYACAGQPFGAEAQDAMTRFAAANPRGRHGRVQYVLSDFGLDEAALRERFAFYTERFGVAPEPLNA